MGVWEDGDKAGGEADGAAVGAGGGDIRGVQLARSCKHAVGVCDNGEEAGGAVDGAVGGAGGGDIGGVYFARPVGSYVGIRQVGRDTRAETATEAATETEWFGGQSQQLVVGTLGEGQEGRCHAKTMTGNEA